MKVYWAVLSARFRMLLQYRAAAAAGLVTQIFWGFIRVMVFTAFYESTTSPQPMTIHETVTYVWLGQATFRLLLWRADPELQEMIHTGTVAYELIRPVDLYWLWLARSVAGIASPTFLRAVPLLLMAWLFFGLHAPASVASGAAWVLATGVAVLLVSAMATLVSISLLWTISGQGVATLLPAAVWCLSGMVIPLPLLPDWAQPILWALPFRGMMDIPFRIYMGNIPPSEWVLAVGQQVAWTAGLICLGRWVLARGMRRLVVQGG